MVDIKDLTSPGGLLSRFSDGFVNVLDTVFCVRTKAHVDNSLGTTDISMEGLGAVGQLEEWVPPMDGNESHHVVRTDLFRLTLRFEHLYCDNLLG